MMFDELERFNSPQAIKAGKQVIAVVVQHNKYKQVFSNCIQQIELMQSIRTPGGILIQADPGMGKTLMLQMVKKHLTDQGGAKDGKRCLHIQLDSGVDTHKLAAAMVYGLGFPMMPARLSLENMNQMINKGMERLRPLALLIDEAQHMCEGNRDITARGLTDWLKVRMDLFGMPVICTGTRTLERLSMINPQFVSRASTTFVIDTFDAGAEWRQVLAAFASMVTVVDMTVLTGPIFKPIHTATKGNMRALKKLLLFGAMHAIESRAKDEKPTLTLEDLSVAYEFTYGEVTGRSNPFVK
jgi:Bacterial TniB protein